MMMNVISNLCIRSKFDTLTSSCGKYALKSVQCMSTIENKFQPASSKQKKKKAEGSENQKSEVFEKVNTFIKYSERVKRRTEAFTPEELVEHARIGREYNRQSFIRHNKFQKDIALKIWLMNEALRSLPPNLREHANTITEDLPPENIPFPEWHTPPIKNFNVQDYMKGMPEDM